MTSLASLAAIIASVGFTREAFAAVAAFDLSSTDDLQVVLVVG